jgi:hypothetical protein
VSITIGDAVLYLRSKDDKLEGDLAKSKTKVYTWGDAIKDYLSTAIGVQMVQNIGRGFEQLGNSVEKLFKKIVQEAMSVKDKISGTAADPFVQLKDSVKELQKMIGEAFIDDLRQLASFLVSTVIPILEKWLTAFKDAPPWVHHLVLGLLGFFFILGKVAPLLSTLIPIFTALGGSGMAAGVGAALTAIGGAILGVIIPIGLLYAAIRLLIYVWQNFGKEATIAAQQLLTIIGYYLTEAVKTIVDFVKRAATAFDQLGYILAIGAEDLWNKVRDWFVKVGTGIVEGIKNGISDAWESLKSWFTDLVASLLPAAENTIEAGSPSKSFARRVGVPMAQGIGLGFAYGMIPIRHMIAAELSSMPGFLQSNGLAGSFPGGNANIDVGVIEFHGRFSQAEMDWFDRRSEHISANTLLRNLGA